MSDSATTLVIGATGNIGREVVTNLRARGRPVRAMSRNPGPGGFAGDLADEHSLTKALDGAAAVFLIWPYLTAAHAPEIIGRMAGRRIVYVSAMSAGSGFWGEVEAAIRTVTADWTFLRPTGFATNTLGWAADIRAGRPVRIPYPAAARSLIHERDLADLATLALTTDGHAGQTYPLSGPATVTQIEQVRLIGEAAGVDARVEEATREEARREMLSWATPGFAESSLDYWASLVTAPEPVTHTFEQVTGVPARTFATWARDHADDFRP